MNPITIKAAITEMIIAATWLLWETAGDAVGTVEEAWTVVGGIIEEVTTSVSMIKCDIIYLACYLSRFENILTNSGDLI